MPRCPPGRENAMFRIHETWHEGASEHSSGACQQDAQKHNPQFARPGPGARRDAGARLDRGEITLGMESS